MNSGLTFHIISGRNRPPVSLPPPPSSPPLIVTLELDGDSFCFFDDLRRRHFPPARNLVPAHVSLFHHLPGDHLPAILETLRTTCHGMRPLPLVVTGVRNLGRGVAFNLESESFARLHAELARVFSSWLTLQDRQPFRPHITIQNKVSTEEARQLYDDLRTRFSRWTVTGVGLTLWRYLDGPWERVETVPSAPTVRRVQE